MVRLLAPVLAFTSEEIWAAMPHDRTADAESVLFNQIPEVNPAYEFDAEQTEYWAKILALKADEQGPGGGPLRQDRQEVHRRQAHPLLQR